jgi:hypothetical protein
MHTAAEAFVKKWDDQNTKAYLLSLEWPMTVAQKPLKIHRGVSSFLPESLFLIANNSPLPLPLPLPLSKTIPPSRTTTTIFHRRQPPLLSYLLTLTYLPTLPYPTLPPFPSRDFILSPLVRYPVFPHQYQTAPSPLRALPDPSNGMFMWQNLQLLSFAHLLQFGSSL